MTTATTTRTAAGVVDAVKVYGGGGTATAVRALDSVSVGFPAGRFTAIMGVAAGALAGLRPARRAARLDVLRAIAGE